MVAGNLITEDSRVKNDGTHQATEFSLMSFKLEDEPDARKVPVPSARVLPVPAALNPDWKMVSVLLRFQRAQPRRGMRSRTPRPARRRDRTPQYTLMERRPGVGGQDVGHGGDDQEPPARRTRGRPRAEGHVGDEQEPPARRTRGRPRAEAYQAVPQPRQVVPHPQPRHALPQPRPRQAVPRQAVPQPRQAVPQPRPRQAVPQPRQLVIGMDGVTGRRINQDRQDRDGELEASYFDDPDQAKTLNSKDGKYGFISQRGFRDVTNFLLKVHAFTYSQNYRIKGYSFVATRPDSDKMLDFFVAESDIYNPEKFKKWLDEAHIHKRWHVSCPGPAWKQMVLNKLSNFESSPGEMTLFLVEMVGNQIQTSASHPTDLHYRRTVLNKHVFLDCYGNMDKNPIHYWHETLSDKVKQPRVLTPIECEVDESKSLEPLIRAAMPGSFWEHCSTCGMIISSSNTDAVRTVCKQHPATVLVGPKGVGKTWCTDVCYKHCCGMTEYNKIDPASSKEAIKRIMAMSTFPPVLEDITSSTKEENIVVSCFDLATYVCKGEQVTSKTMPIINTNVETRCERLIDREVIVKFENTNASPEEMSRAEKLYKEAMSVKKVPVGFTVGYGAYVLSEEFSQELEYFTQLEMEINQCKKRTARGYAIKDVAVKYIYDRHKEVFLSMGHPWEEYLEYLNTKQKQVIRYMHIELSRAVPLVLRFMDEVIELISKWTMTERRRSLAMPESQKHLEKSKSKCKYVIAVRLSEPRFNVVNGIAFDLVKKVCHEAGCVISNCRSFLNVLAQYDPEVGIIDGDTNQQHASILVPFKDLMPSDKILKWCDDLDMGHLKTGLCDSETPSGYLNSLDEPVDNVILDELDNFNDLSMLIDPVLNSSINTSNAGAFEDLLLLNSTTNTSKTGAFQELFLDISAVPCSKPGSDAATSTTSSSTSWTRLDSAASISWTRLDSDSAASTSRTRIGSDAALTISEASLVSSESSYFRCPCGKICQNKRGLTQHRNICQKLPNATMAMAFMCVKCNSVFSTASGLKRHTSSAKCLAKAKSNQHKSLTLALSNSTRNTITSYSGFTSVRHNQSPTISEVQLDPVIQGDDNEETPALQQHQGPPALQQLQGTPAMQQPQETTVLQQPQGIQALQQLQGTLTLQQPQETTVLQQPQGTPALQQPQEIPAPHQPQGTPALQQPQEIPAPHQPQGTTALQQPQETPALQPQQPSCADSEKVNDSGNHIQCQFCSMRCKNRGALANHIKAKHKALQTNQIAAILETTTDATTPASTIATADIQENSSFNCSLCAMVCKSKSGLAAHTRIKHRDAMIAQNQSAATQNESEIPASRTARRMSVTLGNNEDLNQCEACGFVAATPTGLKLHKLSHKKKK